MDKIITYLDISKCHESKTNPRGTKFEGTEFDDLVESIRQQGILVPVIARVHTSGYEIIAGNRRLRAASAAGLKEIPAIVMNVQDNEAREIQIIENLQRADVHPLDEGEAYRHLIEVNKKTIEDVAIRVGKTKKYVKERLFLTNLLPAAAKAFREDKFSEQHAVILARLTHANQKEAFDELMENLEYGYYNKASQLDEWVKERFYDQLSFQPWVKDAEIAKAVGPCTICKPVRATLFGDIPEGKCTDAKCWKTKMDAYIKYMLGQNPNLIQIAKENGRSPWMTAKILDKTQYTGLSIKKKEHCDYAAQAIVVGYDGRGTMVWICADEKCKQHKNQHRDGSNSSIEKEARKKEREKQKRLTALFDSKITKLSKKAKWPLSPTGLEALLAMAIQQAGATVCRIVARRRKLKVEKDTKYGYTNYDYAGAVRLAASTMNKTEKVQLVFELLMDTGYQSIHRGVEKILK